MVKPKSLNVLMLDDSVNAFAQYRKQTHQNMVLNGISDGDGAYVKIYNNIILSPTILEILHNSGTYVKKAVVYYRHVGVCKIVTYTTNDSPLVISNQRNTIGVENDPTSVIVISNSKEDLLGDDVDDETERFCTEPILEYLSTNG